MKTLGVLARATPDPDGGTAHVDVVLVCDDGWTRAMRVDDEGVHMFDSIQTQTLGTPLVSDAGELRGFSVPAGLRGFPRATLEELLARLFRGRESDHLSHGKADAIALARRLWSDTRRT